jgi:ElaA protein
MNEMLPDLKWKYLVRFNDLQPIEIYEILKLRQDVFIIEQNCIYPDIDRIDPDSEHLLLFNGQELAAYCRIVPAGRKFNEWSIGRVTVAYPFRRKKYGKLLMGKALEILKMKQVKTVKIEAQNYLRRFYESFGFEKISAPFDIDGIPHILMTVVFEEHTNSTTQ